MDTPHTQNFKELLTTASALRKEVPTRQSALITKRVLPRISEQAAKSKAPYRRMYETAHNAFSSMADGIKSGDVGVGEFKEFIRELSELTTKVEATETAPAKPPRETANEGSEQWLIQQTQNAQRVMQRYKRYEPLVPRSLPKKFYATRLPVIPLTNPVLNREELNKLKMLDDVFFGYPIIRNQTVLGLNADWVISDYTREIKEALDDVLDVLNAQTGKRFYVLGEPKLRGLVHWCWLVTDNEMRKLNKSTMSGHFQLKSWSFPFEAADDIRTKAPA